MQIINLDHQGFFVTDETLEVIPVAHTTQAHIFLIATSSATALVDECIQNLCGASQSRYALDVPDKRKHVAPIEGNNRSVYTLALTIHIPQTKPLKFTTYKCFIRKRKNRFKMAMV